MLEEPSRKAIKRGVSEEIRKISLSRNFDVTEGKKGN